MRKVNDGKRKEKRMSFLVATNVVASGLPERRLTGKPQAACSCQKNRTVKIAVHYRCASQLPEQQPTGTPTARAKKLIQKWTTMPKLNTTPKIKIKMPLGMTTNPKMKTTDG